MFYYLSFLRPPPQINSLKSPISITPQVSNDLRTEPSPSSVDIYYHWVLHTTSGLPPVALTKPSKLTTWRHTNAYKELAIPPPPTRPDTTCSLVLSCRPNVSGADVSEIVLSHDNIGDVFFPVSSLPIRFTSKPVAGKASKQESIERSFRVLDGEAPALRIREMTSFDLDKVSWRWYPHIQLLIVQELS